MCAAPVLQVRSWGHRGTMPLAEHLFPRERGRGQKEVGGRGTRKGWQKQCEREGVGPQFIPTRYEFFSLLKMLTPPGKARPSPLWSWNAFCQTTQELAWVLTQKGASIHSTHTSPVFSIGFCSDPPTRVRKPTGRALVPCIVIQFSTLGSKLVLTHDTWYRIGSLAQDHTPKEEENQHLLRTGLCQALC